VELIVNQFRRGRPPAGRAQGRSPHHPNHLGYDRGEVSTNRLQINRKSKYNTIRVLYICTVHPQVLQVQLRRGKSVCVTASLRPPVPAHGKVCSFSA